LSTWLRSPCPKAFLFSGETGQGKTSAAFALANDLGVNPEWNLFHIRSGEQDAEAVETTLHALRLVGLRGGWKAAIVDEADWMSAKARQLWLSALEALPSRSIVIFTTNHPERIETTAGRRFVDRCEHVRFSARREQENEANALIGRVWLGEDMPGDPPEATELLDVLDASGRVSFRRVVEQVELWARMLAAGETPIRRCDLPAPDPAQVARVSGPAGDVPAELVAKRRAAALKAVATRRARLTQLFQSPRTGE
jgi:hypothetical protein